MSDADPTCFVCRKHRGEIDLPGGVLYEDDLVCATGSVFLAALSFAARAASNMFFGPLGGAIADHGAEARRLGEGGAGRDT